MVASKEVAHQEYDQEIAEWVDVEEIPPLSAGHQEGDEGDRRPVEQEDDTRHLPPRQAVRPVRDTKDLADRQQNRDADEQERHHGREGGIIKEELPRLD